MALLGQGAGLVSYRADSEFLLRLQQEDALVDGSDRTQRTGMSLEAERGLLCWKLLEGGELQRHLRGRQKGESVTKPADFCSFMIQEVLSGHWAHTLLLRQS